MRKLIKVTLWRVDSEIIAKTLYTSDDYFVVYPLWLSNTTQIFTVVCDLLGDFALINFWIVQSTQPALHFEKLHAGIIKRHSLSPKLQSYKNELVIA